MGKRISRSARPPERERLSLSGLIHQRVRVGRKIASVVGPPTPVAP